MLATHPIHPAEIKKSCKKNFKIPESVLGGSLYYTMSMTVLMIVISVFESDSDSLLI